MTQSNYPWKKYKPCHDDKYKGGSVVGRAISSSLALVVNFNSRTIANGEGIDIFYERWIPRKDKFALEVKKSVPDELMDMKVASLFHKNV